MANFTSNVVDAAIAPFTPAPKPPPMPSASASAANIAAEAKVNRRLRRSVIRTKAPPNPTGDAYNPDHVVLSRMDSENEMEAVPPSPQMQRSLLPAATPADPDPALASQSVKRMSKFVDPRNIKPSLFGAFSLSSADEQAESRRRRASVLSHAFTPMELEFYENNPGCAVLATANRVIRSVSTRQRTRPSRARAHATRGMCQTPARRLTARHRHRHRHPPPIATRHPPPFAETRLRSPCLAACACAVRRSGWPVGSAADRLARLPGALERSARLQLGAQDEGGARPLRLCLL
jgi:hypothetical protein